MKKQGILNSDISRVLSYMRHTDLLCISDAALPTPDDTELIDLSLKAGLPCFIDVLEAVLSDFKVQKVFVAEEIKRGNQETLRGIDFLLGETEKEFISHDELKAKLSSCKAVIRTGECTPYSNIILEAACIF